MKEIQKRKFFSGRIIPGLFICGLWLDVSCVSMARVNSSFESAKTLSKGNMELMGNYSSYYFKYESGNDEKTTEKVNNNFGFRIGYGLSDRIDL